MFKMKRVAVGAALMASCATPVAFAELTANVGAFSEYMFRGIAQTGGAAVQGGIDYAHESGFYVGTWASNIGFGGGTEQDIYAGFGGSVGDAFSYDFGATYYWYPEDSETGEDYSTVEFYAGVGFGPVGISYAYADENNFFIGDGNGKEAGYLSGSLTLPIHEGLDFTAGVGYYSGDEIERFLTAIGSTDDSYVDYSIGLSKSFDPGFTATFQYIGTDIDAGGTNDDAKFVIGLTKSFDL